MSRVNFPFARQMGLATLVLAMAGCASTYQLTLMPRDSGKLYYGEAVEQSADGQANLRVTIEGKTYQGSWVPVSAARSSATMSGFVGWGGRRGGFAAVPVLIDNPEGASAKALLQAADGSGLRCDLRGLGSGTSAGGTCLDDKGLVYDVQMRVGKTGG